MRGKLLICLLVMVTAGLGAVRGDAPARLDHSDIGIYGTCFDFCDFSVYKFFTPESPEQAENYRKMLHDTRAKGKRNLVLIYTFDRVSMSRPIEEYIANTDKLLDALDLEDVYAISLNEENVTWNNGLEVLNRLYDHVKRRYPGLAVYQWMTPYDVPHPKMRADGWIIDPYAYGTQDFRKYLMKYLVEGKPVIACINASVRVASWESSQDQVDVCREFNIPMFFFATDPIHGGTLTWRDWDDPRITKWRSWVMEVLRQVKQMGTEGLPLPSADYSPGQPVEVAGDKQGRYEYVETFDGLKFIDDARITGFLKMRWDGQKEVLDIVPRGGGIVTASLTYHLWNEFEMSAPEVTILGRVNGNPVSSLRVEVSKDALKWVNLPPVKADAQGRIRYTGSPPEGFSRRNIWVRLIAKGGGEGPFACRLEEIRFQGKSALPDRKEVALKPWGSRHVTYTDTFDAPRYLHIADVTGEQDLRWARGEIGTSGGAQGRKVQVELRYKFVAESPMQNIRVTMDSFAHRELGSYNEVGVSLDGKEILAKETTRGKERDDGRYSGQETLDLSNDERFRGIEQFYVHLIMVNAAGVKTNPSNRIYSFTVEADLGEPAS